MDIKKQENPTIWAEFSLAVIIATLSRAGINPPIAAPLDILPRYFVGNVPSTAATLP